MNIFLLGSNPISDILALATRITQRGHEVVNAKLIGRLLRDKEAIPASVVFEAQLHELKRSDLVVFFGDTMSTTDSFLLGYAAGEKMKKKLVVLHSSLAGVTFSQVYVRAGKTVDGAMRTLSLYGV
ncbi:hypothetical protein COU89_03610 [Candidatus Roizmanbacteria bacterium CG10_big_fil_rev_8_21_14_0_10_45_7]|uniref:Uncharacterized protein n=1 Tax=Candidatus Roizmanbacteria bacterium CG10_big_fil_rev_8_21_14_0_10_45_7 TaxID=1974854 RepID=A0A2M8KTX7_9BACT|nr:MAG: hypothetical protein COU89_03610 [Candidatus Roizmanbacteria bacterium CG10_big_fil_rev_8_21_14_0_10_45_7]